jgi:hypothetical protein
MHPATRFWMEVCTVIACHVQTLLLAVFPLLGMAYWQQSQRLSTAERRIAPTYISMAQQPIRYLMLVESDVYGWRPGLLP